MNKSGNESKKTSVFYDVHLLNFLNLVAEECRTVEQLASVVHLQGLLLPANMEGSSDN